MTTPARNTKVKVLRQLAKDPRDRAREFVLHCLSIAVRLEADRGR